MPAALSAVISLCCAMRPKVSMIPSRNVIGRMNPTSVGSEYAEIRARSPKVIWAMGRSLRSVVTCCCRVPLIMTTLMARNATNVGGQICRRIYRFTNRTGLFALRRREL